MKIIAAIALLIIGVGFVSLPGTAIGALSIALLLRH